MLRFTLVLIAAFGLILTACNSGEEPEDVARDPAPTLTSGYRGNVVICPRVGVIGEATPASPTPAPSCEPGANYATLPGIETTIAQPPELPPGSSPLTKYIEFTLDDPAIAAVVAIPLEHAPPIGRTLTWYTYQDGDWRPLDVAVSISESTIAGTDALAQGSFGPVPHSLILLAEG